MSVASYNGTAGSATHSDFFESSFVHEPRSSGEAKAEPAFLTRSNSKMTPEEKEAVGAMQARGLPFVESLLCLRQFDGNYERAFGEVMEILREREENRFADQASKESEALNKQERAKRDKELELQRAYTDVVSDGMFAGSVLLQDVDQLRAAVSLGDEICILDDDDDDDDDGCADTRMLGIKLLVMEQRTKTWFGAKSVHPFFTEFAKKLCKRLAGITKRRSTETETSSGSSKTSSIDTVLRQAVKELEAILFSMPSEVGGMPIPFVEALDRTLMAGGSGRGAGSSGQSCNGDTGGGDEVTLIKPVLDRTSQLQTSETAREDIPLVELC
jgi:hypothetical protein